MTQSFDEWMNKNHGGQFDMPHQRDCYEAGAQSRQAEVDELKATIVKYEAGLRKNKANKHKLLAKNIELQKRINDALSKLNYWVGSENGMAAHIAKGIIEILKGEQND